MKKMDVSSSLADLVVTFRAHLWLPDPGILYVTLGTVAANRMSGDPVWTLLVGSSSSGKSEMTSALYNLPEYFSVSTFTEAGLLSGAAGGPPGLLMQIGEYGLLVFKDLTTILSKQKNEVEGALGSLREVYDGSYVRRLGNHRGAIVWEGKVGFVAAVTDMIDSFNFGQLGERFIRYRLPSASSEDSAKTGDLVLSDYQSKGSQREERAECVSAFFAKLDIPSEVPPFSDDDRRRLNELAQLGTRCRSIVSRDKYKGDLIEGVPAPEGVGRLLGQLAQLLTGMRVIGVPESECQRLVAQVALDGMHPLRRKALSVLVEAQEPQSTTVVAARCALPETSVRRHLQDLRSHGVIELLDFGPERWLLSTLTSKSWPSRFTASRSAQSEFIA
jgi:hypothetical protein